MDAQLVGDGPVGVALEDAPLDGVWRLSREGRVLGLSEDAAAGLGVEGQTPVGRRFTDLLDPDDLDGFDQAWQRAVGTGGAGRATEGVIRGGRSRPLRVRVEPPAPDDGSVIVVVRDPTLSDQARQEAQLLRRVTEAANESMATPDLFDRVVADIATTMGWTEGRVLAAGDGPPAVGTVGAVALPVVADGQVTAVLQFTTPEVVDPDGQLGAMLENLGRQLGSVVEREQARLALGERTAELERSNEELERFAYVASHDLQEPLRKIVGFAELLEHRYQEDIDQDGQEYLGYVVDGARRMQRLIKDLLAYSRAGRAMPALARVDLGDLTRQVLDVLQWSIEEAGAHVTIGELPDVWGDAGQLAEVLTNLVGNAVKYGPPGGATISISAHENGDRDACEVTVTDDGIGIDPQYAEQVFEVFRRLHGPTEYPGTGIGLAITRRFVQANGGRIWVTPNEPQGSVFHLTIRLPHEEAP